MCQCQLSQYNQSYPIIEVKVVYRMGPIILYTANNLKIHLLNCMKANNSDEGLNAA